jgi:hypothetical protein
VFLAGRQAADKRADAKWRANANDIAGVLLFFDKVMLRERVPIFNYGDTFDMGLNLSDRVLARVNDREEILVEVDVEYGPYTEAKSAALEQVKELFDEDDRRGSLLRRRTSRKRHPRATTPGRALPTRFADAASRRWTRKLMRSAARATGIAPA